MSRFIENPNLPKSEVTFLLCGQMNTAITDYFRIRGIKTAFPQVNNDIDSAVGNHIDLSAIHLGNKKVLLDKKQNALALTLENQEAEVYYSLESVSGEYPNDIVLNIAFMGEYVIGNFKYTDKNLRNYLVNKKLINVNQGYAKCSCLIVNEKALITDDLSIYKATTKEGIDSLLISKGDIKLPGHSYGFIGGASGKLSQDEVIFFGDIRIHRDYEIIKAFLNNHGCRIISFDGVDLTDYGGIIPLKEKHN